jgi:hypothetical protein
MRDLFIRAGIAILIAVSLAAECCAGAIPLFQARIWFRSTPSSSQWDADGRGDPRHRISSRIRLGDELRHPRRIRMDMPALEIRLLRKQLSRSKVTGAPSLL